MFAKWIQSYRDLPLLINQWANVVRWEMRHAACSSARPSSSGRKATRCHATAEEAERGDAPDARASTREFAEEVLAMPVLEGRKSDSEKFAGAPAHVLASKP